MYVCTFRCDISVKRNMCYSELEFLNLNEILEQYLCIKTKCFHFRETNPLHAKVSEKKEPVIPTIRKSLGTRNEKNCMFFGAMFFVCRFDH